MIPITYKDHLIEHYKSNWGDRMIEKTFPYGPIRELPPDFRILVFPPNEKRNMWTYATCCMSQPHDARRIELHMFSPYESEEIEELLTAVAHYHRTGARVDCGQTVNFGRGWLDHSQCEFGLISLPYIDGPSLQLGHIDGRVEFLWLLPITKRELDHKKKHGLESLEKKFDQTEFNYIDPHRDSVF
jgi:hypothetical protein